MKSGLMLWVNPMAERQQEDFYATEPRALQLFLNKLQEDKFELKWNIWECACGQWHLAEELKRNWYNVKSTDLVDRGYGDWILDFLKQEDIEYNTSILTNPPFKSAELFVEKWINLIQDWYSMCLFLKIQFLEWQKRKELFKKYPPKYVYCYSARQKCAKDGEFHKYTATTQFYSWFVWEKWFKEETILRWI